MENLRIFVADISSDTVQNMKSYFASQRGIDVVGTFTEGSTLIHALKNNKVDMIITHHPFLYGKKSYILTHDEFKKKMLNVDSGIQKGMAENEDIYLEVPLTISEAILGCKKSIPTIHGNVKINIPAGTDSGDKQRIRGKGVEDNYRHRKGDMFVIFKVLTPKKLSRDEKKLFEKLGESLSKDSEITNFNKFTKENEK